jgi:hypothetical protein
MTGAIGATGATGVTSVRFEHRRVGYGLGIGVAAPRLSWITETDAPGWWQVGYEIEADPGRVRAPCVARPGSDGWPWPPGAAGWLLAVGASPAALIRRSATSRRLPRTNV